MVNSSSDEWNLVPATEYFQPAAAVRDRTQILEWAKTNGHWSGNGKHIKSSRETDRLFHAHEVLGHGATGLVERVTFRSVTMARKKVRIRGKFVEQLREEANIMEKLAHKHIVELVGTYTHGQKDLYILTYPVAACNLQGFLDDIEDARSDTSGDVLDALKRLEALGFKKTGDAVEKALERPLKYLASTLGCVTEAVTFVHSMGVRHQDLKPRNILLGPGQVYLADFGISRDLKDAPHSLTEGFPGGTPLYIAPEVARGEEHHMSPADIYSLGCVFLMVASTLYGAPHGQFETVMGERDPSKRIVLLKEFFIDLRIRASRFGHAAHEASTCAPKNLLGLIELMLSQDPTARPSASQVNSTLHELGGIDQTYHGKCCKKDSTYVSQLIDHKIKAASEGRSEQTRILQRLQAQHESDRQKIDQLLKIQDTYESLAERERKRAVEQFQTLLERRTKELEVANAARKSLEAEVAKLRRQRQPQRHDRKGNATANRNGIDSLAKINGGPARRASNLPIPIRPSTPLRPNLGSGSRESSSGNNTLQSSVNSAFSKTTVASNRSFISEASFDTASAESGSLVSVKGSLPPSPILSHGQMNKCEEGNAKTVEKTIKTWAEMVKIPAITTTLAKARKT